MSDAPTPRRRPYWLVPVFAALMLSPPVWAAAALVAATIAAVALREVRARRARSRRSAATAGDGMLGVDARGERVALTDQQLSAHALIVGASGAGKTTTLLTILTDQIRSGCPVIALDLKGSPAFARELAGAARAAGRPFRLWTPDGPGHWNPLRHGNATELKDKLIGTERFTEPHYQRAAERYLQTVLQVLEHAHTGIEPTLDEVVRLMDPMRLPGALRRVPRPLAQRVADYVAGLTPDQLSGIRGFGTRLAILSESHTGRFLMAPEVGDGPPGDGAQAGGNHADQRSRWDATPGAGAAREIDLRSALAGREVVLFSLNSSTYGKLSAQIGALVIQDLIAATGHRLDEQRDGSLGPQATVAIDEFSALGGDHVAALLARARESRLSVLLVTQELADLERSGAWLRDLVIGNTAVKIAHRQDVPASAQTIAQIAGTKRVWEQTYQHVDPSLWGHGASRTTSRQVEQFVVHPNEIKTLATGEAILITKLPVAQAEKVWVTPTASTRVHADSGITEPGRRHDPPPAHSTGHDPSRPHDLSRPHDPSPHHSPRHDPASQPGRSSDTSAARSVDAPGDPAARAKRTASRDAGTTRSDRLRTRPSPPRGSGAGPPRRTEGRER